MKIIVQYEDQDNIYEIPVEKILKKLGLTKAQLEAACKKAIIEI